MLTVVDFIVSVFEESGVSHSKRDGSSFRRLNNFEGDLFHLISLLDWGEDDSSVALGSKLHFLFAS
jgi:hypothetical protein